MTDTVSDVSDVAENRSIDVPICAMLDDSSCPAEENNEDELLR